MPVEFDLGEKLGVIKIERKRNVSRLLSDLLRDKKVIAGAIDRNIKDKKLVPFGNFRGEGVSGPYILLASIDDREGKYGYGFPYEYTLFVGENGSLYEHKRHDKFGINDWDVKLNNLPDWFTKTVSRDDLEALIKLRFYPTSSNPLV